VRRYILFDHDGVLVETEHLYYSASLRALSEIGVDLPLDEYLRHMTEGKPCWDRARAAGIDEGEIARARRRRDIYYQGCLRSQDIEIPGVMDTLKELASHYRMGIVTTAKRSDFELIHADRNITDYMEFVLTVEDYARAKPFPDPYLAGLQRFGAEPGEVVVVEDSARGLRSAIAAEIDCLIVRNQFTSSHDFSGARLMVDEFEELPAAIRGLS